MKAAYVFPGQGAQYVGMGNDLYEKYPSARAVYDKADEVLGFPLSKLCFEGPEEELIQTVNAQPALLTMSMACLTALREAAPGTVPAPAYMAGHSLGEYSALTAACALEFTQALLLARERGRRMYEAGQAQPGAMAAVIAMSREALTQVCRETGTYIANLNCPGQIVISGTPEAIRAASKLAKERGAKMAIKLQVSGAFHCPMMQPASNGLRPSLLSAPLQAPIVPVIGNTAAQPLDTAEAVRKELLDQVCHCVQWEDTIRYLLSQGVDTFVEIGPGQVLSGLIKRIEPGAAVMNIGSCHEIPTV